MSYKKYASVNHTSMLCSFACAVFCVVGLSMAFAADHKPNVVLLVADDLGYGDLSCYGQKKLQTPNIDRLAGEGMKFTDFYSGNTVCSPSRACLMTGQHPGRVHCRGNGDESVIAALDPSMTTLPRLFKNAGYATGAFGKWGLGVTTEPGRPNPLTHGFDHFSGWKSQRIAHTYYPTSIVRDGKEHKLDPGTYVHDVIMQDAFSFIRNEAEAGIPFFCYIPTAIPHAAMHAPKKLHQKWRKKFPEFDDNVGTYKAGDDDLCPDVRNPIAGFAAMIEHLDEQVGELLDVLREENIEDNTLVLFCSDNGAHREGGHSPEFWNSTGPLRGIKRDLYEGGIRSPLLARWVGTVAPGSQSNHISAFWDIVPTMADLAGQSSPAQSNGVSLLPTLVGNKSDQKEHEYLYWEHPQAVKRDEAIRVGPWKGIVRNWKKGSTGAFELYNLEDDLREQHDVASQHPEIVQNMQRLMVEAHHDIP
ncbi:arylsulfatase [Pirellulales bacterium]|nr:arylsulfatase [Pirellulales bacterium]MDB4365712.1 arylsulfatase [Pirellulales bacterium]